jgi:hypothetical protein
MLFSQIKQYYLILLLLILSSCVKNTDFEQTDDFLLTPEVELNLIYFNLDASRFYDGIANNPILKVRDTTVVDFLDDTDIQERLKRVAFYFEFTNTIPRTFNVDFQFLNEGNVPTYTTNTEIESGSTGSPIQTIFMDNIEDLELEQLMTSNKVVVSVTIHSSDQNLNGTLDLRSKTSYFVEIDE